MDECSHPLLWKFLNFLVAFYRMFQNFQMEHFFSTSSSYQKQKWLCFHWETIGMTKTAETVCGNLMLEVVLLMQAILILFPCLHKEKEKWFLGLANVRWNASTWESSLWPQKDTSKAKAWFFHQFVVIKFLSCTAPETALVMRLL